MKSTTIDPSPPVSFVVATGDEDEIGYNGKMPWHLSADLKHFKQVTLGHAILMGRRTHESIGRPLPGRENLVVSRDVQFQPPGCRVFASIDQALAAAPADRELMVIGGATIFDVMLPLASRVYMTRIHGSFPADTWFPSLDAHVWEEIERDDHKPDDKNPYRYSFLTLERIKKRD
jgi:dihydrofolate reductase